MKKTVSLLLCAALLFTAAVVPASASADNGAVAVETSADMSSVFADGENSLIVFVTGIGQSFSYLFDESYVQPGAFENGTLQDYENYAPLIAEGKYKTRWNLFETDYADSIKEPAVMKLIAKIAGQLLGTLFLRRNRVKEDDARALIRSLFRYNILDGKTRSSDRLVTPRYTLPMSEYPGVYNEDGVWYSEAQDRFFTSVPCREIAREALGENYLDYLYCFNYCAFSYTSDNVKGLHDFIETALRENKVGAEKVVLIPMSMGASVVSSYLAAYPDVADNHVRRVVSVVGCWNGSDVVADLLTQSYAENSADLFYNGIIADMVGEPWGYAVNLLLRLFSKRSLRDLIDSLLPVFAEELLLQCPSLCVTIPTYRYEELRSLIKRDDVRAEADLYNQNQLNLADRIDALERQGVTFSFIAGYGLPFGAITSDFKAFGFMASAEKTNSDEIINVSSTVPGVEAVAYNESFADTEGRELSPDGSVDISGALRKESCWFFKGQKHELEYNNTALKLALRLALGEIKTVSDCDGPEDSFFFPQFNGARNLKKLTRDLLPACRAYLASGGTLTPEQAELYERAAAMPDSTVNDTEADEALVAEFEDMLVSVGALPAPEGQKLTLLTKMLRSLNDFVVKTKGSKGYLDF